jgi:glutamate/tyrosine decarboxylase-like PLP-dependent enzyme
MALHLARHRQWPQVKTTGLSGVRASVFVSESAHYSLLKAAAALGLGTDAVVKVATDHEGRMDPRDLETQIDRAIDLGSTPLLVCATAGTTVFGAFDPLTEIAEVTSAHKIWLHVDCAWGGPALFSKRLRGLVRGIDQADSLTFDAHKLFGASLVCSFIVTKHKGLLVRANDVSGADYLFHDPNESVDRGRMSWQCGRGPDALSFWAIWKSLGTEGLGDFVDRLLFERDRALEWISRQPRLELIHQPDFLNVCVRIHPPSGSNDINWSIKVREALIRDQVAMVNFSQDADGPFLRLILAHPEISSTHIIEILGQALLVRGADQPCEL